MLNSKPNLKLSHTYDSLSNTLWQNKKVVAAKEQERVLLKSRIHHINHPSQHKPSLSSCQIQNQQKYKRLLEKVRQQEKWIKETTSMIEERHYEILEKTARKLECKLHKLTLKTKRIERKIQKSQAIDNKLGKKENDQEQFDQRQDLISLEKQSEELQKLHSFKMNLYKEQVSINKRLNIQLIQLLNYKNGLKMNQKICSDSKNKTTDFKSTNFRSKDSFNSSVWKKCMKHEQVINI